ncbi:hypothetical protein [Mycobacterium sp.]|uniref:hypothetical protein n=1 Tax=Mycobacterium sp. TaxID=1785 RepID=UPI003C757DCB
MNILQFLAHADGEGGFAVVETDNPGRLGRYRQQVRALPDRTELSGGRDGGVGGADREGIEFRG